MSSPTISIIVPIYNSEKYLNKCLDSILGQTFEDFELILVNDGSTDTSRQICEAYREKDQRVTLVNQSNSGAAAARNTGLSAARGTYIGFVDSDDFIAKNMYEELYKQICLNDSDIVFCNMLHINTREEVVHRTKLPFYGICAEKIIKEAVIPAVIGGKLKNYGKEHTIAPSVMRCLFKMSIIEEEYLRFINQLKYNEDTIFVIQYLIRCRKCLFIEGAYYTNGHNPTSVTRTKGKNIWESTVRYIAELKRFSSVMYNGTNEDINERILAVSVTNIYWSLLGIWRLDKGYVEKIRSIRHILGTDVARDNFTFKNILCYPYKIAVTMAFFKLIGGR